MNRPSTKALWPGASSFWDPSETVALCFGYAKTLFWRRRHCGLARHFKTDPTKTVSVLDTRRHFADELMAKQMNRTKVTPSLRRRHLSCSSVCHQLDSWSVLAYPKQRATVLVGSVLKWRARPQCLHRQLKSLRVSKTESYGLSRICFEMTRQATMHSSKAWLLSCR
jgi:hypothetical protein